VHPLSQGVSLAALTLLRFMLFCTCLHKSTGLLESRLSWTKSEIDATRDTADSFLSWRLLYIVWANAEIVRKVIHKPKPKNTTTQCIDLSPDSLHASTISVPLVVLVNIVSEVGPFRFIFGITISVMHRSPVEHRVPVETWLSQTVAILSCLFGLVQRIPQPTLLPRIRCH
jgi:hypothetical protein